MTELAATLPKLRTRRIKPPKLPRWLWTLVAITAFGLLIVFGDVLVFFRDSSPHNAMRIVYVALSTAGWWRQTQAGFKAWKRAQNSSALPREPFADALTVLLWLTGFVLMLANAAIP